MERVAIIKIGAIGDVVMTFPMAVRLREMYPEVHITWIGGSVVRPLVELLGVVDQYIEVDEHTLYHGSFVRKLGVIFGVWSKIFFQSFTRIFLFHPDQRFRLLQLPAFGELIHLKHGTHFQTIVSHAKTYLNCVDQDAIVRYPRLFRKRRKGGMRVSLFPGGAKNSMREQSLKRWPLENYVKLARLLSVEGYEVHILGAPSDAWIEPHFLNYPCSIGTHSLLELGQKIADSDIFITHDTGPMHVAKLTNTKVFGLFGPLDPSMVTDEGGAVTVMYEKKLACQPCYDGKNFARCFNNRCMQLITPEMVMEKVHMLEKIPCKL